MKEITEEFLKEEYVLKQRQKADICRELHIAIATLNKALKRYSIPNNKKINYSCRNIKDEKFGRLFVLDRVENDRFGKAKWRCQCECGNFVTLNASSLLRGLTESCGCLSREKNFKGFNDISGAYWNKLIKGAKQRGLDFILSIEDAWDIYVSQGGLCALSGCSIKLFRNNDKAESRTASLDRIDSTLGYTKSNCQWLHKSINVMKMNLSDSEFIYWCNKISAFSGHRAADTIDSNFSLKGVKYKYESLVPPGLQGVDS